MDVNCRNCGARPHAIECDYCGTPTVIAKPKRKQTESVRFAQWYNSSSTTPYNDYLAKLQNADVGRGVFQLQNTPPSSFWDKLIGGGLAAAESMLGI